MKTLLLLLLSWLFRPPGATAQTRAAGPWRVRYELRREKTNVWAASPDDTTTTLRTQRSVALVPWNSKPTAITLFLHCKNPLLAPVASPRKAAAIHFVATGATLQCTLERLWVVPFAPVVVLRAYRQHRLLFRHAFKAVLPPPPTISCFPSCSASTAAQPSGERQLRTLTLRSLAARDFAQMLPADARYRMTQFRLTLLRKGQTIAARPAGETSWLIRGAQADLRRVSSISQPGDQLQVDVLQVQRKNFCGRVITVPLKQRFVIACSHCLN